jgi:hypothetical protein
MSKFDITMTHTEASLEALSHMQYDLFCRSNRITRTILSAGLVILGVVMSDSWWSILVIAYGCYLMTTTYASANRTAHKLVAQIKASGMGFPSARYEFTNEGMRITVLPEKEGEESQLLPYSQVFGLGEDFQYYYIFRDQYGGYMIPKDTLDEDCTAFRDFIEQQTGKSFVLKKIPLAALRAKIRKKENEPYHL